MGTKIFSLKEENLWKEMVEKSNYNDVHLWPEYMNALGTHINAVPQVFFYGSEKNYVLYPFLKRKIINSTYFDIVSPWYYGGYIFYGNITKIFFKDFLVVFDKYCKEQNIVSEFCRFNPYLNYSIVNENIKPCRSGDVVGIDLTKNINQIFTGFSRSTKREIRASEKNGIEIASGNNDEMIGEFFDIYTESMKRKKAKKFYFFSEDFFKQLRDCFGGKFVIITATENKAVLSSFLFLCQDTIMYYMLSGRNPEKDKKNAAKRIVFEAIKIGKERNAKILDLGSEWQGSSLMVFKTHFSKNLFPRKDFRKIHNMHAYEELCLNKGMELKQLKYESADFFPEYRKE